MTETPTDRSGSGGPEAAELRWRRRHPVKFGFLSLFVMMGATAAFGAFALGGPGWLVGQYWMIFLPALGFLIFGLWVWAIILFFRAANFLLDFSKASWIPDRRRIAIVYYPITFIVALIVTYYFVVVPALTASALPVLWWM